MCRVTLILTNNIRVVKADVLTRAAAAAAAHSQLPLLDAGFVMNNLPEWVFSSASAQTTQPNAWNYKENEKSEANI